MIRPFFPVHNRVNNLAVGEGDLRLRLSGKIHDVYEGFLRNGNLLR